MTSGGEVYGVTSYSNNQGFGVFYKLGGSEGLAALCIFDPRMAADQDMAPYVCHPKVYGAWTLTVGNDGQSLYGTTTGGYGSVWTSSGGGIRVLHEFNLSDGSKPTSLIQASDDYLYGTTWAGGEINAGTVFQVGPSGLFFKTLTSLRIDYKLGSFIPGLNPIARLVERLDTLNNDPANTVRSLYGTAKFGGSGGRGTIYRIGLDGGGFKVVHHFPNNWTASGRSPLGALMLHSNGAIYGTTYQGGTFDHGTLWRLTGTGLPDVPELTAPMKYTTGRIATEAFGKELKDNVMAVRVGVCPYQALDSQGKPICGNGDPDHIKFDLVGRVHKRLTGCADSGRPVGGSQLQLKQLVTIDGVRAVFDEGWGLIRASNTQPALVLRFEAPSPAQLSMIRAAIETELESARRDFVV